MDFETVQQEKEEKSTSCMCMRIYVYTPKNVSIPGAMWIQGVRGRESRKKRHETRERSTRVGVFWDWEREMRDGTDAEPKRSLAHTNRIEQERSIVTREGECSAKRRRTKK